MIVCSRPECQTTAGCTCANRLYEYDRLRAALAAKDARIAELEATLRDIAERRGKCGACGTPASGHDGGYTDCGCAHPKWTAIDPAAHARAALEAASREGRG